MKNNGVMSMIGMATKAGKTVSGEFMTEKAVKGGKALLVIVAEDASENTKKKFQNMCTYYKVPYYILGRKEQLGHSMGKEIRATLAVTDSGFKTAIEKQLNK
ncbi:MAG: 50S ribosomal protein L7ae [Lachnospiraceae bacterium]|nr:50S ribosomal protein L7ae [Lachnospiraceae bacterium]